MNIEAGLTNAKFSTDNNKLAIKNLRERVTFLEKYRTKTEIALLLVFFMFFVISTIKLFVESTAVDILFLSHLPIVIYSFFILIF